jgi:hypothetical protein
MQMNAERREARELRRKADELAIEAAADWKLDLGAGDSEEGDIGNGDDAAEQTRKPERSVRDIMIELLTQDYAA